MPKQPTPPRKAKAELLSTTATAISVDVPVSVSINRACELTGLPRSTIYDLLSENRLRASKIGRRTLIEYQSICDLIERGIRERDAGIAASIKKGRAILAAEKWEGGRS